MIILEILAKTVAIALDAIMTAMFLRVILSLFFEVEEMPFYSFLCLITEPAILPVRFLLYVLNVGQDSPIDWSFMGTYWLLFFVQLFLPQI